MTPPREPRNGEVCNPADFPGLDVKVGDPIDIGVINEYAERVGWRCRFRYAAGFGFAPEIYYPEEESS